MNADEVRETMGVRADAVKKHREEHGDNGRPEMSDAAKEVTQSAIERIRGLFRPSEAEAAK